MEQHEIRQISLDFALRTSYEDESTERIVARAEAFWNFLTP